MGNLTNPMQWAAQERLRFIERSAWWRGIVNRQDLQAVYGVSQAQASSDLQKYLELNPSSLSYSLKRKRYEGTPQMACVLHEPRLEEALSQFLEAGDGAGFGAQSFFSMGSRSGGETRPGAQVATVTLPVRQASAGVKRSIFLAVLHRQRIRIHYLSLTSKKVGWRWIAPHAFGHDGYRWHVRAWCEENRDYRDFVLSRITETEWPTGLAGAAEVPGPDEDTDWNRWVALELVPNPQLSLEQQESVRADYDLTVSGAGGSGSGDKSGSLRLNVRAAMLDYTLAHLRLPAENGMVGVPFLVKEDVRR